MALPEPVKSTHNSLPIDDRSDTETSEPSHLHQVKEESSVEKTLRVYSEDHSVTHIDDPTLPEPAKPKLAQYCIHCGEGHNSRKCPLPRTQICYRCGEMGHKRKICTQTPNAKQERETNDQYRRRIATANRHTPDTRMLQQLKCKKDMYKRKLQETREELSNTQEELEEALRIIARPSNGFTQGPHPLRFTDKFKNTKQLCYWCGRKGHLIDTCSHFKNETDIDAIINEFRN